MITDACHDIMRYMMCESCQMSKCNDEMSDALYERYKMPNVVKKSVVGNVLWLQFHMPCQM